MVKEDIETVIDRLCDYVQANGSVTLNQAASALGRTPDQLEHLALLLEEKGFLEIRYTIGGVRLCSVDEKSGTHAERETHEGADDDGKRLEREVLGSGNLLKFFERDLERRIGIAEGLINDIEKKGSLTTEELGELKREVSIALEQLKSFRAEIEKLGRKETEFHEKLADFRRRLDSMKGVGARKSNAGALEQLVERLSELIALLQDALMRPVYSIKKALQRKESAKASPAGVAMPLPPKKIQARARTSIAEPVKSPAQRTTARRRRRYAKARAAMFSRLRAALQHTHKDSRRTLVARKGRRK